LPSDFIKFLGGCPNLLELDISGCIFDEDLCFSAVSAKLHHFKAFHARLTMAQLIQIATRAPNMRRLEISPNHLYMNNLTQQQLDTLFMLLTNRPVMILVFGIRKKQLA
jgi:hypothetical protein